ncbi:hypothetical protein M9H77_21286 [Catharanthus roseus]|uniref:Uncharacterized protein n=1 Tax=Catharanthus roseus TaxID=4058 RepID=A0ACC0ALX0_CATRO|nr:hypothetical protein M9H77_21286 [Catharanthus roseus]
MNLLKIIYERVFKLPLSVFIFLGLRHLFQYGTRVTSCATNATSLEKIGTTIFMPSKGCEGLKKRRESHLGTNRRNLGGYPMHNNLWRYCNFSPDTRSYEHILMIATRAIDLELELVIMIYLIKDFQEMTRRMEAQPIKTWSLMKQSLRNEFVVENHERQRKGQAKEKFMESSMHEMCRKVNKLAQTQDVIDRKLIHHEKKNTCTFVKEEKFKRRRSEECFENK